MNTSLVTYILQALEGSEINFILLDDIQIQRVEVYDDTLVPKTTLRLKHETTLEVVPFAFVPDPARRFLVVCHIRTDALQAVELIQKNVLVPLSSTTIQRLVPEMKLA